MSKVIIYIATSLNGYIAGKNDDLSWLEAFNSENEDYGYSEFIENVGTVIMGARTYEQSLQHPERRIAGIKNYVLSSKSMTVPQGIDAAFYNGDLAALVTKIKKENAQDIFVVGGGQVISSFLNASLVDELLQFVAPVILKEGIAMYSKIDKEICLQLSETTRYETGMVKLHYLRKK